MLFKPKDRASELKTPKIPKISLPDSPTMSVRPETPLRPRRQSMTPARNTTMTTDTPSSRYATLSNPKTMTAATRDLPTTQTHARGRSSNKQGRNSSAPEKMYDEPAPPAKVEVQKTPRPSAMARRLSEAGGGPSRTNPRKAVNFVFDVSQGDDYATDSGTPVTWARPSHCLRNDVGLAPAKSDSHSTSRGMRSGESSSQDELVATWSVNVVAASPMPRPSNSVLRRLDGYATDSGESRSRASTARSHHRASSSPQTHSSARKDVGQLEAEPMPVMEVPLPLGAMPRGSPLRWNEPPPGLHPKLLADVSGRPPLRFNIIYPPARPYIKTWHDIPQIVDDATMEESATETEISIMAIQLKCEPLLPPWEFVVRKRRGTPVMCRDVFEAIHKEYDVELTEAEKAKIPKAHLELYMQGFEKRCKAVPVLTAVEQRRGLKRVDLLLGKTFFRGLTKPLPNAPWVVELQPPPRGYTL